MLVTVRSTTIRYAAHAGHHSQHVVRVGIDTNLGGGSSGNSSRGQHQLESGVIDSGEVAGTGWLMFLRPECEGINVDAGIGSTGVVLEGLNNVEVGSLSLGDAVLAVELQLGSDDGVLAPAVEVEGSLGQDEGAGIGQHGAGGGSTVAVEDTRRVPVLGGGGVGSRDEAIEGTGHLEDTSGNEGVGTRGLSGAAEDVDRGGESINGIGVVEGLGTEDLEQSTVALKGGAIVNVGIGLDDPDELLAGVVEVNLDLIGRRTDRLITSVLELLNEVLMGVLGHLSSLVSIQEDEINVDRSGDEGLLVGSSDSLGGTTADGSQILNSPQALTNRSEIDVNLDLVILYITYTPPFGVFIGISVFD